MIRLATRGSALARAQAGEVVRALRARFPELQVTTVVVDSDGDLNPTAPVPELLGQGWFTSRLERALSLGEVDGAVHSAKDLPTELRPELGIAGFLPRADPRDAVVVGPGLSWPRLPSGAQVGTSSPRRGAQLLALLPELAVVPVRGNIDTRIRRVAEGELEACVIAMAGLARLGRESEGVALDPLTESTPAPAQGAIAVEVRVGSDFAELAGEIDDPVTRSCVDAERQLLIRMGGGCHLPLGALAEPLPGGRAQLTVAWAPQPRSAVLRITESAAIDRLGELALALAAELR